QVALANDDGTLTLWAPRTGQAVLWPGHAHTVATLACSPDGQTLARGDPDFSIRLIDAQTRTERVALRGHTRRLTAVTFSADGGLVASAAHDRTIRLWDVATGKEKEARPVAPIAAGADFPALCLAFSPDSRMLAAGVAQIDHPSAIELRDLRTGQVRHLEGH